MKLEKEEGLEIARLSAARWSDADRKRAEAIYEHCPFSREEINERRAKALKHVQAPNENMQKMLMSLGVARLSPSPKNPSWLRVVCYNRSYFNNCILRFFDGVDTVYAKVVYCVQSPLMMCMCSCQKLPQSASSSSADPWVQVGTSAHKFRLHLGSFSWSDDGGLDEEWQVDVLPEVRFNKGGVLVSGSSWRSMGEMTAWAPPCPAAWPQAACEVCRAA